MTTGGNTPRPPGAANAHGYKLLFEVVRGYIGPLWAAHEPEANPPTVFVRRIRAPKPRLASLQEAANRARDISDPPLPRIFAITTEGDQLDIVTPWAEGEPLSSLMRGAQVQRKPIAPAVASSIAMQLLEQLVVLHEARGLDASMRIGGIHPDSVFVGTDGHVMLLDVCVASVASRIDPWRHDTGRVGYIAPEQLTSDAALTDATDVFVVGVLLWEMLMNRRLFPGASYAAVRERIKQAQVPRVDEPRSGVKGIPKELADLIARALSVEPDARYATARELRDSLRSAAPIADAAAVGTVVEQLGSLVLRKRRTTLDRAMKTPSAGPLSMGGQRQSVPPRASSVPPRASVPPRPLTSSRPPAPNTTPMPPIAPRSVPPAAAAPTSAFSARRTSGPVRPPSPPRPPSVRLTPPPPEAEPSPAPAPAKLDVSKRPLPPSARIQPAKMVALAPAAGDARPAPPIETEKPPPAAAPPMPAPAPAPVAGPQATAAVTPVPVPVAPAQPQIVPEAPALSAEPPVVEELSAQAPAPPVPEASPGTPPEEQRPQASPSEADTRLSPVAAATSPLPVQPPSLHPEPLSADVALAQDLPVHRPQPAASEVGEPAAMRGRPKIPRNVLIGGGAAAVALVALIIAFSGGDKDEAIPEQAASKPAPERTEARPAAPPPAPKPAEPPAPVEAKAAPEPTPAAEEPAPPEPKAKEEAKPEPAEEPAAESQSEEKPRKRREPAVVEPSEPPPKPRARHRPAPGSGAADESYKPGGI